MDLDKLVFCCVGENGTVISILKVCNDSRHLFCLGISFEMT